jgi:hypothetical protein
MQNLKKKMKNKRKNNVKIKEKINLKNLKYNIL